MAGLVVYIILMVQISDFLQSCSIYSILLISTSPLLLVGGFTPKFTGVVTARSCCAYYQPVQLQMIFDRGAALDVLHFSILKLNVTLGNYKKRQFTITNIISHTMVNGCNEVGDMFFLLPYPLVLFIFGPRHEKNCLRGFENNKGADQPPHSRRLVSMFVIRFLESIISKLATSKISIFYLVSVAEQTGLCLVFF